MAVALTTDGRQLTEGEWLKIRSGGIGASEAAAALGFDDRTDPLSLWVRKRKAVEGGVGTLPMRVGKALEPLVAELYMERAGNRLVRQQVLYQHPELPLLATLDAIDDCETPVEFKTISERRARELELGPDDTDEVPIGWLIQVHQQMLLAGACAAHIACLIGNSDFRVFTVELQPGLIDTMVPRLVEFWRCVQTGEPPASNCGDPAVWKAAFTPREFEGDEAMRTAVELYEQLGRLERQTAKQRAEVQSQILKACEGRQCLLPEKKVRISQSWRHGYTVQPALVTRMDIVKRRA
jgi:putative phage-type endonuclease